MHIRLLIIGTLLLSFSAFANGRAPAVEDFVGIEVDHRESTPHGSESLYNLESDLKKVSEAEAQKVEAPVAKEFRWDPLTVTALGVLGLIPMFACLVTMRKLRRKATLENTSNIQVLEKYRKEREARKNQEKTSEHKKAS